LRFLSTNFPQRVLLTFTLGEGARPDYWGALPASHWLDLRESPPLAGDFGQPQQNRLTCRPTLF
jgi:hypothetical protein